ncbi:MAG: site-specific integrase [Chloroflexi bacterium]|nr:site-specific integrase [Chloroflexota bacterium]
MIVATSTRSMEAAKAAQREKLKAYLDSLAAPVSSPSAGTVAAYLARWLDERATMGTLGPRTVATYRLLVDGWIVPVVGSIDLADLSATDVRAMIRHALDAGRSTQWAKHTLTVLRSALSDAVDAGVLDRNVARLVPAPRVQRQEVVRLTTDQVIAVLDALDDDPTPSKDDPEQRRGGPHPMRALFTLALTTGLRQGELLSLYWRDIDWTKRTLTVVRTLYPIKGTPRPGRKRAQRVDWAELEPKTEASRRTIPLSGVAMDALTDHRRGAVSATLVFPRRYGEGPLDPAHVTRRWHALLDALELPSIPFHATRHTAIAEALDMSGADLRAAQLMAGHSKITTTTDYYGGLATRAVQRIADGMDARYSRSNSPSKRAAEP